MSDDKISISDEYREKWEYIRHTELRKDKQIQWFYLATSAVITFVYSSKSGNNITAWPPLLAIYFYSLLTCLSSIIQKANYDTYLKKVRVIDGTIKPGKYPSIKGKIFTSFKSRYYILALISTFIFSLLLKEFSTLKLIPESLLLLSTACAINFISLAALSFSNLIEAKY